jgi:hypothetical protein
MTSESVHPYWDRPSGVFTLLEIMQFYVASFTVTVANLERAWHALAIGMMPVDHGPEWTPEAAWDAVDRALQEAGEALTEGPFPASVLEQYERTQARCQTHHPVNAPVAIAALQDLAHSMVNALTYHVFFIVRYAESRNYLKPLARFGKAPDKFPNAVDDMSGASRCFALEEWDASVFHAMRVLEHGLRWLAAQFQNLTLKKAVEFENWESIIGNIQARIDEELRSSAPRLPKRDADLVFYGRAAAELRYFKDAWRNHVMHVRNVPYEEGTAGGVINHVASFMSVLAERA